MMEHRVLECDFESIFAGDENNSIEPIQRLAASCDEYRLRLIDSLESYQTQEKGRCS